MHRVLIIFIAIVLCEAAVVPSTGTKEENNLSREESKPQVFTTNNQLQSYQPLQANAFPSSQYFYPSYPEYSSTGYSSQSGYGSHLIPATLSSQQESHWVADIASSMLPFSSQVLIQGARAGLYVLHFFLIVILGGAFTTIVCTFTPICSISFAGFGINRNLVKEQVAELARTYITPENINTATVLVSKAVDKYTAMQREKNPGVKDEGKPVN